MKTLYYRFLHRWLMTKAHNHGWHQMKLIGPLSPASPDGRDWQHKCEWCGLRIPFNPTTDIDQRVAEQMQPENLLIEIF